MLIHRNFFTNGQGASVAERKLPWFKDLRLNQRNRTKRQRMILANGPKIRKNPQDESRLYFAMLGRKAGQHTRRSWSEEWKRRRKTSREWRQQVEDHDVRRGNSAQVFDGLRVSRVSFRWWAGQHVSESFPPEHGSPTRTTHSTAVPFGRCFTLASGLFWLRS